MFLLLPVNRPASNLPKSKGGKSSQTSTSTARLHLPAQHTGGLIPKNRRFACHFEGVGWLLLEFELTKLGLYFGRAMES